MNTTKSLSLEQGVRLNEILKEFNLTEMSISSVAIWFSSRNYMYRYINHLSKEEIFDLFYKLRYEQLFTRNCKSVFKVELIVDAVKNTFGISLSLFTEEELEF